MPSLARTRAILEETPLDALLETERRLLGELRDLRVAAELRQASVGTTAQGVEERAEQLSTSLSSLPDTLSSHDEQTASALASAVGTIRNDLRSYGMMVGGALALAMLLLVVTIASLGR